MRQDKKRGRDACNVPASACPNFFGSQGFGETDLISVFDNHSCEEIHTSIKSGFAGSIFKFHGPHLPSIIDRCAVEDDQIEYKKSIVSRSGIIKTVCAYANNYMNREIGLLFVGIEEEDDKETGRKAIPVRPISGIDEAKIESTENEIKSLLGHVHPKPDYRLLQDQIDDRFYIILAVEPGNEGPYETDQLAEKEKKIQLKAGRYIRVRRDSRLPNHTEEFELLRKFAGFHFSSELNSQVTLDDLSFEYMKEYLARTN